MTGVACFCPSPDAFVFSGGVIESTGFVFWNPPPPSSSQSLFVCRSRDVTLGVETLKLVLFLFKVSIQNYETVV